MKAQVELSMQQAAVESYRLNKGNIPQHKSKTNSVINSMLAEIKEEKTMSPGEICNKNGHTDSIIFLHYGLWCKCRRCGRVTIK